MARGGYIENLGASPTLRKRLFYGVCLPLRLLLVMLAFRYEDERMFIPLCIALSIVSIVTNLKKELNNSKVWWNRNTHMLNALGVLAVSVAGYPKYVKFILVSDVFHGLFSSIENGNW
ncbi:unnamed protein product [Ectocarpus sp. 6 AP-2014]